MPRHHFRYEEALKQAPGGGKGTVGKDGKNMTADGMLAGATSKYAALPAVAKRSVSLDFLIRFTDEHDCWDLTSGEVATPLRT